MEITSCNTSFQDLQMAPLPGKAKVLAMSYTALFNLAIHYLPDLIYHSPFSLHWFHYCFLGPFGEALTLGPLHLQRALPPASTWLDPSSPSSLFSSVTI